VQSPYKKASRVRSAQSRKSDPDRGKMAMSFLTLRCMKVSENLFRSGPSSSDRTLNKKTSAWPSSYCLSVAR
jgi:hypothetical protein